jgi:hypothetical protein
MSSPHAPRIRLTVAASLIVTLFAAPAAYAQDVKVTIKVDVSKDIERAINRITHETLPALGHDLTNALQDLADGLADLDDAGHAGPPRRQTRGEAQQTDASTQPLAIGPTGTLDVTTMFGSISVTAGTGAPTLEVRTSRGRTSSDLRSPVTVEARNGRVRVNSGGARSDRDIALVVTVPAGVAVNAHSMYGAIAMTGIRGNVSAESMSGAVTLSHVRNVADTHTFGGTVTVTDTDADNIDLHSIGGNVTLTRVKARTVSVHTIGGAIAGEGLDCEEATLNTLSGPLTFRGTLAKSGHYQLQTHSGALRFDPAGSTGFELDADSYAGGIHADQAMRLRATPGRRHGLSGTVGDGAATVSLETYSGSITIGKI